MYATTSYPSSWLTSFKDIHDETISINLQLNMAEKRAEVLKAENKELIDRWMAEKGREAEKMNMTLQDQK